MRRMQAREEPLENETATHSSTLAREIPWTEAPTVHGVTKESDTTVKFCLTVREQNRNLEHYLYYFKLWASQLVRVVKNPPANAGDVRDAGSIPGLGRFPGGGHGIPFWYSCLENSHGRGACWVTVHRSKQSDTTE